MSLSKDYNEELYHYGVLGMKWGKRKAEQRGTTYTYRSHSTKKYERKAAKAKNQADAEKYANRAKRSKELDRREQSIAEKTSTGKVFATRLLLTGGVGAKNYQQFQAMGDTKVTAAAKAFADVMLTGGIGSRVQKALYLRQDERK